MLLIHGYHHDIINGIDEAGASVSFILDPPLGARPLLGIDAEVPIVLGVLGDCILPRCELHCEGIIELQALVPRGDVRLHGVVVLGRKFLILVGYAIHARKVDLAMLLHGKNCPTHDGHGKRHVDDVELEADLHRKST